MFLVESLARYLQRSGLGTMGTDLFIKSLPPSPIPCVGVFDIGGSTDVSSPISRPEFQILVRDRSDQLALTKAWSVYNAVNAKWNILYSDEAQTVVVEGRMKSMVLPGASYYDPANNVVYSLNFLYLCKQIN